MHDDIKKIDASTRPGEAIFIDAQQTPPNDLSAVMPRSGTYVPGAVVRRDLLRSNAI